MVLGPIHVVSEFSNKGSRFSRMKVTDDAPKTLMRVDLCASNLHNESIPQCARLLISTRGVSDYIQQEWVNFCFLVLIPLLISIMTLVFGIILYTREKNRRIRDFEDHLR